MSAAVFEVSDLFLRPLTPTLNLFLYVNHKLYLSSNVCYNSPGSRDSCQAKEPQILYHN